jgi:hypothetical protein
MTEQLVGFIRRWGAPLAARITGVVFLAGVVLKVLDWEATREAMTAYTLLDPFPSWLVAAGSVGLESLVAVGLLGGRWWRRWGLPAVSAFLLVTGVILALETAAGGTGDCGCIPFLPRGIGWASTVQNLAAALFYFALWRTVAAGAAAAATSTGPTTAGVRG